MFLKPGAHILNGDFVVNGLVAHQQFDRRLGAAVKRGHIVEGFRLGVGFLHGGHRGIADSLKLFFFGQGLGAVENVRGKIDVLFVVERPALFNQADRLVRAVDQGSFISLGAAWQQGALRRDLAALAVAQHGCLVGIAGAVVQFEHRIKRHAVHGAIGHGQVTRRNARVLQLLLKNDAGDPAGQVDEIAVLAHLSQKG